MPRGKVIGGSSSINAMIYLRGSAHDYNEWNKKYNLTGCSYKDVIPYFKKSEKQQDLNKSSEYHSFTGKWKI